MDFCDCADGAVCDCCCTSEWCDTCCPGGRSASEKREARSILRDARFRRKDKVWFVDGGQLLMGTVKKVTVNDARAIIYIVLTAERAQHLVAEAQVFPTRDEAAYAVFNRKQE